MPVLPEFQPEGRPGEAAGSFAQGVSDRNSWMAQAQERQLREQEMQQKAQQIAQERILMPVRQAQAAADLVAAHSALTTAQQLQESRASAFALAAPAQKAFDGILKITDAKQRADAALGWVNQYGQLSNVKELSQQFSNNHDIAVKMYQDYQLQERLAATLRGQQIKAQTPLVRNATAYSDAVQAGDTEMAGILKARLDKDAALFTPSDKNEYLMLTHALANPTPGVDPSVIAARLEQLSGRVINTPPAGAPTRPAPAQSAPSQPAQGVDDFGQPIQMEQPAASAPAPSAGSPAPTVAPVVATAGAQRITPANKTQAQEHLAKLTSLVHQGVDVLNSLSGHPEYLGVRGSAGSTISDSLLPALGFDTGDQGRVSARQKIGIFRDSLLKTIADLPRISQAEVSDIKKSLPDTGWGSNLAADETKLRNVLQLLGRKAQEEQARLGTATQGAK